MVRLSPATLETPTPLVGDPDGHLYRHTKRPEWGVSIMVWERGDARAYQFEDGQLRKIRKGYYKLFQPADDLGERTESIRNNLLRVAGAGVDPDRKVIEPVCPFSAQVDLFTKLYPKGFQDPEWIDDHRASDGAALKRHRGPISTEAKEVLSAARCKEARSSGEYAGLSETVADLLARTNLVPISYAKALRGLDPDEKARYGESVDALLHGEGGYEERFRAYLATQRTLFKTRPAWRPATAVAGLVQADEHVIVRRSAFLRQAGSVAPGARYSPRATSRSYLNFLRVANGTRERLSAAGHEPRDLLDVHDFIWTTLRKSALEHLGSSG